MKAGALGNLRQLSGPMTPFKENFLWARSGRSMKVTTYDEKQSNAESQLIAYSSRGPEHGSMGGKPLEWFDCCGL